MKPLTVTIPRFKFTRLNCQEAVEEAMEAAGLKFPTSLFKAMGEPEPKDVFKIRFRRAVQDAGYVGFEYLINVGDAHIIQLLPGPGPSKGVTVISKP